MSQLVASMAYKFIRDARDARFLLSGQLKFTPPAELNDPAELFPVFDKANVQASFDVLMRDGYSDNDLIDLQRQQAVLEKLAPEFRMANAPLSTQQANAALSLLEFFGLENLERMLFATAQAISSRVGVHCMTKRFDSFPMWAHYANNAQGAVVAFVDLDHVFRGDKTGVLSAVKDVRYPDQRHGVTFLPNSHEGLFFEKAEDWSYEQELRIVLAQSDCKLVNIAGKSHFVYQVPQKNILRVYLGWRIPASHRNEILAAHRDLESAAEIFATAIDSRGRFIPGERIA